jgi:hypothetical protein
MDTQTDMRTFASFIEQERERIKEAIKAANAKRQEAEDEIGQLEAQIAAIAAYDAALKGKKPSTAPRTPRGPKGAKRQALLDLIAEHPDGMTRGEIIMAMNARGDQSASQSISNSLAALKTRGRVTQEGKKYIVRTEQETVSSEVEAL